MTTWAIGLLKSSDFPAGGWFWLAVPSLWWKLYHPRNAGQKGFYSDPQTPRQMSKETGWGAGGCKNASYNAQLIWSPGGVSQHPQTPQGKATWPFSRSPGP